jgi:hypothetical protein
MRPKEVGAMRRLFAMFAALGLLAAMVPSVAADEPSSGLVYNFEDVRATWVRSVSECVDEGVFFGFTRGKDLYRMPGFHYLGTDQKAGVWWWQNDRCDQTDDLLFFYTGDVSDPPPAFDIDQQLEWAWADVAIPVSNGTETFVFTFDLEYSATAKPSVRLSHTGPGPDLFRQQERVAPAAVTGTATSTIPGGWAGFQLVKAEISRFTMVAIDH